MTDRVRALLERARRRTGDGWQRRLWAAEALAADDSGPAVRRQARILERILAAVPVVIADDELLVGTHPDSPPPSPAPPGVHLLPDIHALRTEEQRRAMGAALFSSGIKTGHLTPDYDRLLAEGYGGLARRIQGHQAVAEPAVAEELAAMASTVQAAVAFVRRHAAEARRLGREDVAATCDRIAWEPPRTLREALQLLWFTYLIQCLEEGEGTAAFALGRFDQYLWPFWQADRRAGRPREELVDLIGCCWVKLNEFPGLQVINLTLAGTTADGGDAANDLSLACLELMAAMQTPAPSLSVRWHPGLAPKVLEQALQLATLGCGQPAFYGDATAQQAMRLAGVSAADAVGVVPGGCVELGLQGCCNPWVGNFFNLPKCLELALHDGVDALTGTRVGPATGPLATFDDVLAAYEAQVAQGVELMAASENLCDRIAGEYLPYPFLSTIVADCLDRGRDITAGGARYNFIEDQGVGLAHVVDSLLNVRRLVDERGELTLAELTAKLDQGFAGDEPLRRRLQHWRPAYGDGAPEVAELTRRVVHGYFDAVERHRNPRGGPHRAGLLVWTLYHEWADCVGALPDGRRRGDALVASIGPRGEVPVDSPTSVVLDATAFDHARCAGALTLNLRFDAASVRGVRGRAALAALLQAYFERGGLQVQLNVVDSRVLRAAQAEPAAHADLLVRVSGFVARFVTLPQRMQDEVIARAELRLVP